MFARRPPDKVLISAQSHCRGRNREFPKIKARESRKYIFCFFGGHNTKGLGHKMGRNLGLFRCQSATAVVGLSLAFSQSLIHVMLVKSFGSSFALSVEAALALVAPEPEEDKRGQLGCPNLRRKRGKEESKGSLEPRCGEDTAVSCGTSWGEEKSRVRGGAWLEGGDGKHGEDLGRAEEPRRGLRLEERIRGRENGLGGTAREALRSGRGEKTFTGQEKEKQDYGRRGR